MMLFDKNPVSIGSRPKYQGEPTFEYYNRSSRTDIRTIKHVVEDWFSRIPQSAQYDLRQRFRSGEDSQHRAALFELFLHELFTKMGFSLVFHPKVNGPRRPDFLVRNGGPALFYLEATTSGASVEEVGEQRRIAQVYDLINGQLRNKDFYLAIFVKGAPATPPRGARLRRDLDRWLGTLDWQTVRAKWDLGLDAVPSYRWQHDGWDVTFKPVPKSQEHRGEQAMTPIGITMPLQVQRLASDEGIKKAVEAKSNYNLDKPLLLAVNLMEDFCKTYDVMNALFGHETVVFTAAGTKPGARLHDGAWEGPKGPRNTSISAVLIFHDLQVWNAKQDRLWIVHNPWAANPLNPALLPFSQYVPNKEQGALSLVKGTMTVGKVLGLPDPWPPEEQDEQQLVFEILGKALRQLADRISVAFVYGSMARQEDTTESDVDLMIIGNATLEEVVSEFSGIERLIGRPVNPAVYSVAEFKAKLASGNHFLTSVMRHQKVFVIGDDGELRNMGAEPVAQSGTHKSGRD